MTEAKKGQACIIRGIDGDARLLNRVAAIGLTPGCPVKIIRNEARQPILLYSRDTVIALSRREGEKIMLEVTNGNLCGNGDSHDDHRQSFRAEPCS
jgi:ferrous iron transport protein A